MTDAMTPERLAGMGIAEALAELRSVTAGPAQGQPWEPADFISDTTGEAFATVVATILNAALDGSLVADAVREAVALMVERAAERLEANRAQLNFAAILGLLRDAPLPEAIVTALSGWLDAIAEAIRALVPASALAELQALRDDVTGWISNAQVAREKWSEYEARAEAAEAELVTLRAQVERLTDLIQWAHDTLWELNPSNYGHDDVCKVNDAAVEVILGLSPVIGETHGHSAEWWATRAALSEGAAP